MLSHLVTHPEVRVDPAVPVPEWELSEAGRRRAARLPELAFVADVRRVVASAERKAQQTAAALAEHLGLPVLTDPDLGENDRSATGFVPPAEFERLADAFFARPRSSVRGWETAAAAQRRIVTAVRRWAAASPLPTAYVAHGAVGTLLWCDLAGLPVDRRHDQPGQGCWFSFDAASWTAGQPWRRIGDDDREGPAARRLG